MDAGIVKEFGSPQELLEDKNSIFFSKTSFFLLQLHNPTLFRFNKKAWCNNLETERDHHPKKNFIQIKSIKIPLFCFSQQLVDFFDFFFFEDCKVCIIKKKIGAIIEIIDFFKIMKKSEEKRKQPLISQFFGKKKQEEKNIQKAPITLPKLSGRTPVKSKVSENEKVRFKSKYLWE